MSTDDPDTLTVEEAISMIAPKGEIHTFRDCGTMLLGAHWTRDDIIIALAKAKRIARTGPTAASTGHGIAIIEQDDDVLFVETIQ